MGGVMKKLSGYHLYMDRLRSGGNLVFWCSCGTSARVSENMPMTMRCLPPCEKLMIVMDTEDMP
jgi:hypothetical protein